MYDKFYRVLQKARPYYLKPDLIIKLTSLNRILYITTTLSFLISAPYGQWIFLFNNIIFFKNKIEHMFLAIFIA
jgi:hypothetical protein